MNKKLLGDDLQRPDIEHFRQQDKIPVILLLDDIRSLSNVGSIFRTADAFNVLELILCGITGQPPHRDIQRTALGATESVEWAYEKDIHEALDALEARFNRLVILSIEQCEASIAPHKAVSKMALLDQGTVAALVLGNEVNGVQQTIIDRSAAAIEIPQSGTKHSLNVTVAAGVVLWELYKAFELQDLK